MTDSRSIGVFDSGLGGLTILRHLLQTFPSEQFYYLGDTARIPYGTKSHEALIRCAQQNIDFLEKQKVKAIVIACNSASSVLPHLQSNVPLLGVIEPGALQASRETKNKIVGVIGTRATVKARAYVAALQKIDPQIQVAQQACPLLVPLVEEGWDDDPLTNLVVYRYLNPLLQQGIDTLVLGCTHYPILRKAIQKATGPNVQLVESGTALTEILRTQFTTGQLLPRDDQDDLQHRLLTTDYSELFESLSKRIIPSLEWKPELIHLEA